MVQPEVLIALLIAACFIFFVSACLVTVIVIVIVIVTGSTAGLRDFAKVLAAFGRVIRLRFRFGN
ncbi:MULTISPECIES: hypothetical protein [unclassified Rhodococcus (in: high G+C Gram-positive bacteria)]|jgi:hypothetical protein|uniref:hypothetical protein n=1 Tax=unclassified Rhodococcus (in: high G+C Gram-positive bacteria) TaxID=192944 RepID=UPI0002FE98A9|nr:hypothetical protein [Rhodococcus sp. DK17]